MRNSNDWHRKSINKRFNDSKNQRKSDQLRAISFKNSDKTNQLSTTHDSFSRSNVTADYEMFQLREALC
jgi:hypothetical protein